LTKAFRTLLADADEEVIVNKSIGEAEEDSTEDTPKPQAIAKRQDSGLHPRMLPAVSKTVRIRFKESNITTQIAKLYKECKTSIRLRR
jgi:hypothetical protein